MALLVSLIFQKCSFFIYLVRIAKSFIVPSTPSNMLTVSLTDIGTSSELTVIQWAFLSELDCVQPGKGCVWKSESVQHPGWDGARPQCIIAWLIGSIENWQLFPSKPKSWPGDGKKRLVFSQQKIPEFRRKSKEGFGRSQLQASSLLK